MPTASRGGQRPARHAARAIAKHEVEAHQRESRRRMRARETLRVRQRIGTVREQRDIRTVAAEAGEIPGTVHVGDGLESADDQCGEQHRQQHETGRSPPRAQTGNHERQRPQHQRRRRHTANDPAAAGVQQSACPPFAAAGAQPLRRVALKYHSRAITRSREKTSSAPKAMVKASRGHHRCRRQNSGLPYAGGARSRARGRGVGDLGFGPSRLRRNLSGGSVATGLLQDMTSKVARCVSVG